MMKPYADLAVAQAIASLIAEKLREWGHTTLRMVVSKEIIQGDRWVIRLTQSYDGGSSILFIMPHDEESQENPGNYRVGTPFGDRPLQDSDLMRVADIGEKVFD
jgi:hypothetical protein